MNVGEDLQNTQPSIFIGSTTEAQGIAVALQALLDESASVRVWSQEVFEQNCGNLDNLLKVASDFDFACILATPDDFTESRGNGLRSPRDNIVFEFGLFLGSLGRTRVFFLYPRAAPIKLPTDLEGVSFIKYKQPDCANPAESVLAPAAAKILKVVKREGRRPTPLQRRYESILEHGGIDRVSSLTDAALSFSRQRFGYYKQIRQHILRHEVIPARYYYITEEGAEFWIRMSSDPQYRFHSNSMRLVRQIAPRFAQCVISCSGSRSDIDFVSLGSGDGEKDRIFLDAFIRKGAEALIYYPIDISDKLLVECVKNVFQENFDDRGLRTKAIIGDFCDLSVLRSVYEDRPSPNVFSILGNILGNTDEAEILGALKRSMYKGDFAIIEVNCGTGEISASGSFLSSPLVLEYTCLPLRMAGLSVSVDNASVHVAASMSVLRSAHSIATVYRGVEIDGHKIASAPLSYDHRYDFAAFAPELQSYLGVEVMDSETVGNAAAFLLRKV